VLPQTRFWRSYWLMSHPDTHHTRRAAEVYDFVAKSVVAAKASLVIALCAAVLFIPGSAKLT